MIDAPVEKGYLTISADSNLISDSTTFPQNEGGTTPWAAQILYNMLDRSYTEIIKNSLPHIPPEGKEMPYTGEAQALVTAGQVDADKGTMEYSLDKTAWSTDLPTGTEPGTYTVYWRITAQPGYFDVPVQSVTTKITSVYTPPKTWDLTYNGSDQTLIDPNHSGVIEPSVGTMQFRLSDQDAWSTEFPKQVNCGSYQVQWRILGVNGSTVIGSGTLTATIKPAPLQCTPPSGRDLPGTGAAQALAAGGSVTGGTLLYSLDNSTWTSAPPEKSEPGTYTVYWKAEPDANHSGGRSGSFQSTITAQPAPAEPGSAPRYPVEVSDKAPLGGTVQTNLNSASERDAVYINAVPSPGYRLQSLTAVDKEGRSLPVTELGRHRYTFKMSNCKVTVTAAFTRAEDGWNSGFALCSQGGTCPVGQFSDAQSAAWYHDGLHFCLENGLMSGADSQALRPNAPISRGAFLSVLWRLSGSPVVNYLLPFADVPEGLWCAEAVRWAASEGLVSGYESGLFHPAGTLTREQLAAILCRYARHKGLEEAMSDSESLSAFADGAAASGYAADALGWACRTGLMEGQTVDGRRMLNPQGPASRAQAAAVIARYVTTIA